MKGEQKRISFVNLDFPVQYIVQHNILDTAITIMANHKPRKCKTTTCNIDIVLYRSYLKRHETAANFPVVQASSHYCMSYCNYFIINKATQFSPDVYVMEYKKIL